MSTQQQQPKYFTLQQLLNTYNKLEHNVYNFDIINGQNAKQIEQQNKVILIFGSTSSGKTVVQYYLSGDELVYGVEEKKQLPYIVPQKVFENAIVEKTPTTVTTRVPNVRSAIPYQSTDRVATIQIPVLNDLKPYQQSVLYLFLQHIFKTLPRLHFLLVTQQSTLDDVSQLIQNIQLITELFNLSKTQQQQLIFNHLSIIINKTSPDSQQSDVKEKLQEVNEDLVKQENQILYDILHKVLQEGRVYIIKEDQPQLVEQRELFSKIVKNSQFTAFDKYSIQLNLLKQITKEDQTLLKLIKKQQLISLWGQSVQKFSQLVNYLSDQKNRQNNLQNIISPHKQQIYQLVNQFYKELNSQNNNNNDIPKFNGALDNPIKSALSLFINTIHSIQEYSAFNYSLNQVYNTLFNLKHSTISTISQSIFKKQPTNNFSVAYLKAFLTFINELLLMILYMTQILNYNQQTNSQEQQVLSKECLIAPTEEMLAKLKKEFTGFNLDLLAVKTKKTKKTGKNKPVKQPKPKLITITQLQQQFNKQTKTKKSSSPLSQIFNLPNTHFKLSLLIGQIKPNQKFNKEQQFQKTITIIKEICKILHMMQLFVEKMMFLLLIPDWNGIQQCIDIIDKDELNRRKCYRIQSVQFLNRLGMYAMSKNRKRLAKRIFALIDSFANGSEEKYKIEIDSNSELSETWYQGYVHSLYRQQVQKTKPYPLIVEMVKQKEQQDQHKITKINQLHYLMKQKLT